MAERARSLKLDQTLNSAQNTFQLAVHANGCRSCGVCLEEPSSSWRNELLGTLGLIVVPESRSVSSSLTGFE